jgi:hypothetical protein
MSSDHEAEIRASVAARHDLGPGYDEAVAEGLVERIGAEIDKRIDARLGQLGTADAAGPAGSPGYQRPAAPAGAQPGVPQPAGAVGGPGAAPPGGAAPAGPGGYQGYQAPVGYQGYQGYQGYMGPVLPPGYQMGPPPVRPSAVGQRNVATTITALGSIALGVAATAILSHGDNGGGRGFTALLIWVVIAIINVAYARRA